MCIFLHFENKKASHSITLLLSALSHLRSGFMFFSQAKRPKLRETTPNATIGEIAKQLGAAWKIMTTDQRKPYEERAKKDRARYEQQMELFRRGEFSHDDPVVVSEEDDEDEDED